MDLRGLRSGWLIAACCAAGLSRASSALGQTAAPSLQRRADAAAPASPSSVVETQWNLVDLNGSAEGIAAAGKVYIYLQRDGDKLSGSDGCNRFFGSYDLSGASLQFHSVAQTLMACPGGFAAREAELVEALKLATSYQLVDNILQLKVDDRVLARFEARKK